MKKSELEKLLEEMTLSEKVEQLVQLHGGFFGNIDIYTGPVVDFKMTPEQPYRTGSILGEHGAAHLKELQDKIMEKQSHHIPALFMADVIHGYKTAFPVPIAIGSSFNPELAEKITSAAAKEASAAGVHVAFSPMVDLVRDSRWGRCMESTGEDPWLNARMAESQVKGFQGENFGENGKMASCIKHFAAYGAVQSGRDYNVTELSEHTLFEDYLVSYRAAVKAGVSMVMTAFNTIDRKPCTTNKRLLRDILREDMGFDGVVISDYGAVSESITHGSSENHRDAAKKAMEAGCDIDMMSECYLQNLESLVNDGELSESLIDEAVMRILVLKNKLGLFENPYKDASEEDEKKYCFCDEHKKLSREAAEETIVLLKNDGLLPLNEKQKIAVVGSLADSSEITGSWALFVDKSQTVTMKNAIEELYPNADVTFIPFDEITEKMLSDVKTADVVILALGEDQSQTGESFSKADISLSKVHSELFNAVYDVNKNVITVLFGGRPLAVPELAKKTNSLIEAWLPGSCGCYALADILFGKVNPSGRLSMSMPYCVGQLPISYSAFSTGRPKPKMDGFCPYVSNYMDVPNVPLYPFGYGLSYSEVEYSAVSLDKNILSKNDKITASVTLENKSNIAVKEAVQLYIRDIKGSVVRPMRELKGLQKISLEAGEKRTVDFEITEAMLRFYDADMNYVSENGDFTLWIGHDSMTENCADFRLEK